MSTSRTDPTPGVNAPVQEKPGFLKAVFRFGVVGGIGILVNLAVLSLLFRGLDLPFVPSSAAATEVAILGNYVGNEMWTFHYRQLNFGRLWRFNLSMVVGALVQVGSATLLKNTGMNYLLAQTIGICIGSTFNFVANFGWIWRK